MRKLIILAATAGLTGCVSFQAPSYTSPPGSDQRIRAAQAEYRVELTMAPADDDGAITCRGAGPVTVGGGRRYSDYIVDALSQDLTNVGAFSPLAARKIQASYTKITFKSSLGAANWYIHGTYTIDGDSVRVDTIYNDRSSFSGNKACSNMARYFPMAVAAHLAQLYGTHLFKSAQPEPALEHFP